MNNQLVFVKDLSLNAVPFTTDEIIAEYSGNSLHATKQMIRNHQKEIEKFGVLAFEMRKPIKGSKGGRPVKKYSLNREQATFLITLLDNTEQVVQFKFNLVKQFFAKDKELQERQIKREAGKLTTSIMNDAIKAREDLDSHAFTYFNQLVYKTTLGKNVTQIKRERGVPKSTPATEYLSAAELNKVNLMKQKIAVLLELGMEYQAIKALITGAGIKALMVNKTQHRAREEA
ncbi:Rha family transcriptional regulator [Liquorilactobacillus satsumensis]|uniref:Prophage Lp4 protein 3, phage family repressor n=1 Tax=Liquorilactobacillus satsumensis DSM 16230 = JCM 12392 TaxID=1423801 RepID=A0A0R1V2E0_9LACO|nr:Rha family transcriptional regulator [Liquorilactobacillus satsumensis]KRL99767.1 prophage Lp4 protein 3, phage family repressor [Liquorilactobacillus satsumensis DSM 16230 = JCM 12392]